jgi:hypothetical protein
LNASGTKATITNTSGAPVFTLSGKGTSATYAPTMTDEGAVAGGLDIASQALQTVSDYFGKLTDTENSVQTNQNGLLASTLQSNSDLAAQVQSQGATSTNATLIKLALIAGAALLGFAFFKKK